MEAFKAWENFLEDLVFAYLRGERDAAGKVVSTTLSLNSDEPETFASIMNGGRGSYIDWANPDRHVRPRLKTYFRPALDEKLSGGLSELREMLKCRNAIAHSSSRSLKEIVDLWTQKTGATKFPVRSAELLLVEDPANPPMTWFERYLRVLEVLSQELVEV